MKIGEETLPVGNNQVKLPKTLDKFVPTVEKLIHLVYEDVIQLILHQISWMCDAILMPKNRQVAAINNCILTTIEEN